MIRPRRNRSTSAIRAMVRETRVHLDQLIYPLFLVPGEQVKEEIPSMPGQFRLSKDMLLREIGECISLGIDKFAIFPSIPEDFKDKTASYSWSEDNFYLHTIAEAKIQYPESFLLSDVAMDPYNSDGHDGLVEDGQILNDETLPILAKMAVAQAQAGIDMIGPSDMMDGRVAYLREALDDSGYQQTGIMSYTAKYASGFYGPFRDALDSAPKAGDKRTYQMDPANRDEAIRETELDIQEGADIVMVKPALSYLDIISDLKAYSEVPVAAYNVSGEYAMVHAACKNGWLSYEQVMPEVLTSIVRAGADIVLTYFAKDYAKMIKK